MTPHGIFSLALRPLPPPQLFLLSSPLHCEGPQLYAGLHCQRRSVGLHSAQGRNQPHNSASAAACFVSLRSLTATAWAHELLRLILCGKEVLLKCEHLLDKKSVCTDCNKNFLPSPETLPAPTHTRSKWLCRLRSDLSLPTGEPWHTGGLRDTEPLSPQSGRACSWMASSVARVSVCHITTIILRVMMSTRLEHSDKGNLLLYQQELPKNV